MTLPATVGILMLDTRFPRPLGDIGHPGTWQALGLQPLYRVVSGAFPTEIVNPHAHPAWLEHFIEAGQALVNQGAQVLTTSCGFLARHQTALQSSLTVPVISSALLWCCELDAPGILTFDAQRLGAPELDGAGVASGTPVVGAAAQSEFHRRIMGNDIHMDLGQAEHDVVSAALELVKHHPEVRHIVLECTNMPPYADAIRAATDLPTLDVMGLVARCLNPGRAQSRNRSGRKAAASTEVVSPDIICANISPLAGPVDKPMC
ncbi:MAG: aspartate/glutamate racemase family protein [Alphaproteobacteria bacterium]|nr:aspartate/glutamate racemase family protein [Alphaproteobacteria bacterium]